MDINHSKHSILYSSMYHCKISIVHLVFVGCIKFSFDCNTLLCDINDLHYKLWIVSIDVKITLACMTLSMLFNL